MKYSLHVFENIWKPQPLYLQGLRPFFTLLCCQSQDFKNIIWILTVLSWIVNIMRLIKSVRQVLNFVRRLSYFWGEKNGQVALFWLQALWHLRRVRGRRGDVQIRTRCYSHDLWLQRAFYYSFLWWVLLESEIILHSRFSKSRLLYFLIHSQACIEKVYINHILSYNLY